ncbi:hypothetical protein SAMN05428988_2748 [Chitinophaga sp. YR573]|uniref:hypothetical protein n=1 Tax=Chitinophaga sp. YR573 TaxID=1881040 RepID=UPI0008C7B83B|nr:hypothetical protein [Chitinophaga sp. YR573]SEW17584.1 hypothetical protein SAMN05428988_2748 [Chitinophaga sp. YR573]
MTISFDLDDTLIPGVKRFNTEPQTFLQKLCGIEKLRLGTIDLIQTLQAQGHTIFIYTTSFRKTRKIWWTFRSYGIKPDKIINQTIHEKILGENRKYYSKYPPAFAIDIHIDDSKGVEMEGNRFNFKTIIIAEDNPNWTEFILNTISA